MHAHCPVFQITTQGPYAPLCTFLEVLLTFVWCAVGFQQAMLDCAADTASARALSEQGLGTPAERALRAGTPPRLPRSAGARRTP